MALPPQRSSAALALAEAAPGEQRGGALKAGVFFGALAGIISILVNVLGAAITLSIYQEGVARYQRAYDAYRQCVAANSASSACTPPVDGRGPFLLVWGVYLGTYVACGFLALTLYFLAGRAAIHTPTARKRIGVVAAMLAALLCSALYIGASIAAIVAQASPFTAGAVVPDNVDPLTYHLGAAIGVGALLLVAVAPTVGLAALMGFLGARRAMIRLGAESVGA